VYLEKCVIAAEGSARKAKSLRSGLFPTNFCFVAPSFYGNHTLVLRTSLGFMR
jgi:hypothetical protein